MKSDRPMNRNENALYKHQIRMLQGQKMKSLIEKVAKKYDVPKDHLVAPRSIPVYFNKRLKRTWGVNHGSYMEISYEHYKMSLKINKGKNVRRTIWHEILHSFIGANCEVCCSSAKNFNSACEEFRKVVMAYGGEGSQHNSWQYKVVCGTEHCSGWYKSTKKQHSFRCRICKKVNVSAGEYKKLEKIAAINSIRIKVEIDNYSIWKSNKKLF